MIFSTHLTLSVKFLFFGKKVTPISYNLENLVIETLKGLCMFFCEKLKKYFL